VGFSPIGWWGARKAPNFKSVISNPLILYRVLNLGVSKISLDTL